MMQNGGGFSMNGQGLSQEQVDELNAIFGLGRTGKRKKRVYLWESVLQAHEMGMYQVIPITSSWALRHEGRVMNHCVGSYEKLCRDGFIRVFSIRDLLGNRVATLSLLFYDGDWHLEQIKGYSNAEVCIAEEVYYDGEQTQTWIEMTDLHYVAYEVLRCYRKAWENDLLD